MVDGMDRRGLLARSWKWGLGLFVAAGAWTSWDLLKPLETGGFGGEVRAVPPDAVPEVGALEVPAARAYLVRLGDDIVALSEKCAHLGCRVPYCEPSNQFECPCHGSVFNRAGELITGPSPRGLDRYPVEEGEDGLLYIDTGVTEEGPPPGTFTIDEPGGNGTCAVEGGH